MALKSLSDPERRREIVHRITALQPGLARQWGKMRVHEAFRLNFFAFT